jgi:hypothetical protein
VSYADQLEITHPGLLDAVRQVESSGNPNALSNKGAGGLYGLMPGTASDMGVDRWNPSQSREGSAHYITQQLDSSGGDLDMAMRKYQGGPHNQKNWGPQNEAYPGKILAALQNPQGQASPRQSGGNDLESIISGNPAPPAKSAPAATDNGSLESIVGSGMGGNANAGSNSAVQENSDNGINGPGSPNQLGHAGTQAGQTSPAVVGTVRPQATSGTPATSVDPTRFSGYDIGTNILGKVQDLNDAGVGAVRGLADIPGTAATLIGKGLDYTGLTQGAGDNALKNSNDLQALLATAQHDPNGWANTFGNIGGLVAGTAPAMGIKALTIGEDTAKLARALKYVGQGSLVGLAGSGGNDMVKQTAIGGALGPLGGYGAEAVGTGLSKLGNTALAQRIGAAIRAAGEEGAPAITRADAEAAYAARPASQMGGSYGERVTQKEAAMDAESAATRAADPSAPMEVNIVGGQSPDDLATGLKNAGAGRGIESVTDMPQAVADDIAAAKTNGIPQAHAQREADLRYVGAEPTIGSTTRDPTAQRLEKVHANLDTPAGAELSQRAADNNAALHGKTLETLDGYGGTSTPGEAALTSARSLAQASDAAKAKVSQLYETARAADGDAQLNTDALREALQSPELATPTNPQVKQLAEGIRAHLAAVDARTGTTLRSPDDIEQIRQLANSAYDPMGGKVNGAIRSVGKALDDSLDQLDNVSAGYKAARAAHRNWAQQYDNPDGVSHLIRRDAGGNFVNADTGQLADNRLLQGPNEKPFMQVVGQLKAGGHTEALDRLKAEVVQRLHDGATRTAGDMKNNSVFSPSGYSRAFKSIGMNRMRALFSTDEIAHLATIGRAAQTLHEAVPGVVNGSNTATTLINAAGLADAADAIKNGATPSAKAKATVLAARVLAHGAALPLHATGAGVGAHVAVEGITKLAKGAAQKAADAAGEKAVADAIRLHLDPAAARAAANENTVRAATAAKRALLVRGLAQYGAPAAAASQGSK